MPGTPTGNVLAPKPVRARCASPALVTHTMLGLFLGWWCVFVRVRCERVVRRRGLLCRERHARSEGALPAPVITASTLRAAASDVAVTPMLPLHACCASSARTRIASAATGSPSPRLSLSPMQTSSTTRYCASSRERSRHNACVSASGKAHVYWRHQRAHQRSLR